QLRDVARFALSLVHWNVCQGVKKQQSAGRIAARIHATMCVGWNDNLHFRCERDPDREGRAPKRRGLLFVRRRDDGAPSLSPSCALERRCASETRVAAY